MQCSIRGLLFMFFLFANGLVGGIFLLTFSFFLFPFSFRLYRSYCDSIAESWFPVPCAFYELILGTKMVFSGDWPLKKERVILVSNHPTRLDWGFIWSLLMRTNTYRFEKIALKYDLKVIPGFGWAMQHFGFLFLQRKIEIDQKTIESALTHFASHNYPIELLIFPEGTDLTEYSMHKSEQYALKNNLPIYKHVLHPRVKGFQMAVHLLRSSVDAVYDITIGYPDRVPHTEFSIINGNYPKEIHFHVKRYEINHLPETEDDLGSWCMQRWKEKEELLASFNRDKRFCPALASSQEMDRIESRVRWKQLMCLLLWTGISLVSCYALYVSYWLRVYFVFGCLVELLITHLFGGMEKLEIRYHHKGNVGDQHQHSS